MRTRALIVVEKGKTELGEVRLPPLGDEDVLIETEYSGISIGTERWILLGMYKNVTFPLVPGYQRSGIVKEVGRMVRTFSPGDRVFAPGSNLAEGEKVRRMFGGHTAEAVCPESSLVKLPNGVSQEEGAVVKMAAIALHGVKMAGAHSPDLVLVLGQGMIGQMSAQVLRALGCRVIATDVDPARLDLSRRYSAHVAINPAETALGHIIGKEREQGVDLLVDTTAMASTINAAFELVRRGGKVLLQGYYPGETCLDLFTPHARELTFYNPTNHVKEDLIEAIQLLAANKLQIRPLIGVVSSPEEMAREYPRLLNDPSRCVSAVIKWR